MTDGPIDWVEENIDNIDLEEEPSALFKNWDKFSAETQAEIEGMIADAREAALEELSDEELDEGIEAVGK